MCHCASTSCCKECARRDHQLWPFGTCREAVECGQEQGGSFCPFQACVIDARNRPRESIKAVHTWGWMRSISRSECGSGRVMIWGSPFPTRKVRARCGVRDLSGGWGGAAAGGYSSYETPMKLLISRMCCFNPHDVAHPLMNSVYAVKP